MLLWKSSLSAEPLLLSGWSQGRNFLHLTHLHVVEPKSSARDVSWILASLFASASWATAKILPELFLILYLVMLGRKKALLSTGCTSVCGLLLSTSALLPLQEQLILMVCSPNHNAGPKPSEAFPVYPVVLDGPPHTVQPLQHGAFIFAI